MLSCTLLVRHAEPISWLLALTGQSPFSRVETGLALQGGKDGQTGGSTWQLQHLEHNAEVRCQDTSIMYKECRAKQR
jgi:hypothetical protein